MRSLFSSLKLFNGQFLVETVKIQNKPLTNWSNSRQASSKDIGISSLSIIS